MPYDTLPPAAAHRVELDGRERLIVSGVDDVDRFDENEIVMTTSAGTLIVTGESLHIGKLSLDGGELHVDGHIDSLLYEDARPPLRRAAQPPVRRLSHGHRDRRTARRPLALPFSRRGVRPAL